MWHRLHLYKFYQYTLYYSMTNGLFWQHLFIWRKISILLYPPTTFFGESKLFCSKWKWFKVGKLLTGKNSFAFLLHTVKKACWKDSQRSSFFIDRYKTLRKGILVEEALSSCQRVRNKGTCADNHKASKDLLFKKEMSLPLSSWFLGSKLYCL